MPYFEGASGRVHYRSWLAERPQAAIIFLHGFGEHSGLYERLAAALNGAAIDLWAVDEIGHGLSDGDRGIVGSIDALEENARLLTSIARQTRPAIPVVLAGHSLGGVTAAVAVTHNPEPWIGVILSGTPISPPAWAREALEAGGEGLALEPADLSADPWYLDALANDLLAFTETDGSPLDSLPTAWEELGRRFASVSIPVLFVHGADDPVAPVDVSRHWATELPTASLSEFAGARHDVLNETVHAEVAAAIASWVLEHGVAAASESRGPAASQDTRLAAAGS
jgi:alpha-beta hydrolase superfamily lysophospholipase